MLRSVSAYKRYGQAYTDAEGSVGSETRPLQIQKVSSTVSDDDDDDDDEQPGKFCGTPEQPLLLKLVHESNHFAP